MLCGSSAIDALFSSSHEIRTAFITDWGRGVSDFQSSLAGELSIQTQFCSTLFRISSAPASSTPDSDLMHGAEQLSRGYIAVVNPKSFWEAVQSRCSMLAGVGKFVNGTCDVTITIGPLSESQAAPLVR